MRVCGYSAQDRVQRKARLERAKIPGLLGRRVAPWALGSIRRGARVCGGGVSSFPFWAAGIHACSEPATVMVWHMEHARNHKA